VFVFGEPVNLGHLGPVREKADRLPGMPARYALIIAGFPEDHRDPRPRCDSWRSSAQSSYPLEVRECEARPALSRCTLSLRRETARPPQKRASHAANSNRHHVSCDSSKHLLSPHLTTGAGPRTIGRWYGRYLWIGCEVTSSARLRGNSRALLGLSHSGLIEPHHLVIEFSGTRRPSRRVHRSPQCIAASLGEPAIHRRQVSCSCGPATTIRG